MRRVIMYMLISAIILSRRFYSLSRLPFFSYYNNRVITMIKQFNSSTAISYARKWAFSRNPDYYNFDAIGGDCTNFISQCVYAGGGIMNYTRDVGWYYNSLSDRAAAWTGVEQLYRFLMPNRGAGPFAETVPLNAARAGDIIQLGSADGAFYHSCLVVGTVNGIPHIAAHTNDAYDLPLTAYSFDRSRCIHIIGVRYF